MKNKPAPEKKGWFSRLKSGLKRTRSQFTSGLATVVLGKKTIDDDLLEELETLLLTADVGVNATDAILESLTDQVNRKQLTDPQALIDALQTQLTSLITPYSQPLTTDVNTGPFVLLMVGVNGAGKTTSIAKIAHHFKQQGKQIMLAAGDTFRAAAVEQLQVWGERNDVPVIAQATGSDSASVIFDAMQAAQARNVDILIADTAGRLHTQEHLMRELEKNQTRNYQTKPQCPTRNHARTRRRHGPKCPQSSRAIPPKRGYHRPHFNQTRWHRQRRYHFRHHQRPETPHPLHWHWRKNRRLKAFSSRRVRIGFV